MKKIRLVHFLDLFEGGGEKEQCALVCLERLWMIAVMVVMLISYSHVVRVVLVLSRVGPILRSRYGLSDKNWIVSWYVTFQQGDTRGV